MKHNYLILLFALFGQLGFAQEMGYIKFDFQADSAYLVVDYENEQAVKIADGDSVQLLSGSHVFEIFHPFKGKKKGWYYVYPDSVRAVKLPLPPNGLNLVDLNNNLGAYKTFNANTFVISDLETDIYFEDEYLGTGSVLMNMPHGQGTFELRNPEFGSKKVTLTIPETELLATNQQILPSRGTSAALGVFPGASQIYKKQHVKGGAFILGSVLLLNQTVKKHNAYITEKDYFDNLLEEYNTATDEELALRLGDLTDNQRQVVQDADNKFQMFAASTVLFYALNVFDAVRSKPRGGFRQDRSVRFYLSRHIELPQEFTTATVQVNF